MPHQRSRASLSSSMTSDLFLIFFAACTAYTRYVLDVGQNGDWVGLQMALAPCLLGYGAAAKMLHDHEKTVREGNTYWAWIKNYNEEDYTDAVKLGSSESFSVSLSICLLTKKQPCSKSIFNCSHLRELKSLFRSSSMLSRYMLVLLNSDV